MKRNKIISLFFVFVFAWLSCAPASAQVWTSPNKLLITTLGAACTAAQAGKQAITIGGAPMFCNGATYAAVSSGGGGGTTSGSQWYTTVGSDTFTVPAGINTVYVTMIGGGGSGGSLDRSAGGGSGYFTIDMPFSVTPGASIAYTVGAGGTSPTSGTGTGNNGSATTFNGYTVAGGYGAGYVASPNGVATSASSLYGGPGGAGGGGGIQIRLTDMAGPGWGGYSAYYTGSGTYLAGHGGGGSAPTAYVATTYAAGVFPSPMYGTPCSGCNGSPGLYGGLGGMGIASSGYSAYAGGGGGGIYGGRGGNAYSASVYFYPSGGGGGGFTAYPPGSCVNASSVYRGCDGWGYGAGGGGGQQQVGVALGGAGKSGAIFIRW